MKGSTTKTSACAGFAALLLLCPGARGDDPGLIEDLGVADVDVVLGARSMARIGDLVVFATRDAAGTTGDPWVTDGTAAGTRRPADLHPDSDIGRATVLGSAGGRAVVEAGGRGRPELWAVDPVTGAAERLTSFGDASTYSYVSAGSFATVGGRGVFAVVGDDPHGGVWTTDGTRAGTRRLAAEGATTAYGGSSPVIFGIGDRAVFFPGGGDPRPFTTDGTDEGTTPLDAPSLDRRAETFAVGKTLFYLGDDGLWATDGRSDHARRLVAPDRIPPHFFPVGESLFFHDPSRRLVFSPGDAVWGARPTPFRDGRRNPFTTALAASGRRLFVYRTNGSRRDGVVWAADAGAARPHAVRTSDGRKLRTPTRPMLPVDDVGAVVFVGPKTHGVGAELWISDGSRRGTHLLADVLPGPESSDVDPVIVLGDRVLCVADDASGARRLVSVELPR